MLKLEDLKPIENYVFDSYIDSILQKDKDGKSYRVAIYREIKTNKCVAVMKYEKPIVFRDSVRNALDERKKIYKKEIKNVSEKILNGFNDEIVNRYANRVEYQEKKIYSLIHGKTNNDEESIYTHTILTLFTEVINENYKNPEMKQYILARLAKTEHFGNTSVYLDAIEKLIQTCKESKELTNSIEPTL